MSLIDRKSDFEVAVNIKDALKTMLPAVKNIKGFRFKSYSEAQNNICLTTGVSIWSWGENVTIQCYYIDENHTRIEVTSAPKVSTTLVDYGRGRRNLSKVLDVVFPLFGLS